MRNAFNFTNLFNVWLDGRRESHICFCIRSIVIYCLSWSIWRGFSLTEIYSWKKEGYINSLCREFPRVIHDALPNFIGCSSLKVQPRSPTTKFLHPVRWTSMGHLALWMSLWLTYDFIKALFGHLEILVHWLISDSTRVDTLLCTTSKNHVH